MFCIDGVNLSIVITVEVKENKVTNINMTSMISLPYILKKTFIGSSLFISDGSLKLSFHILSAVNFLSLYIEFSVVTDHYYLAIT